MLQGSVFPAEFVAQSSGWRTTERWPSTDLCNNKVAQSHTLRTPRCVSIETQSLAQPQKAHKSCPMIYHASALSRLGQRQISSSIVQEFVEYFCAVTDTNLCMSTFTTLKYTYLNNSPNVARLAQQRLMWQDGPRVTHCQRLSAFLSRLRHWHSHKKHINLVQWCTMPLLFPD